MCKEMDIKESVTKITSEHGGSMDLPNFKTIRLFRKIIHSFTRGCRKRRKANVRRVVTVCKPDNVKKSALRSRSG